MTHMTLVCIQWVRLSHVVSSCGPLCGLVTCCVMYDVSRRKKEKRKWVWLDREDWELVLHQSIITSYISLLTKAPQRLPKSSQKAFTKALMIIQGLQGKKASVKTFDC
eukprot:1065948-Pelagomonas_calceolata.AAC.1